MVYSSYYEKNITPAQAEIALGYYHTWCEKNGQTPEVIRAVDIDENNICHVLYHAEIEGFQIERNYEEEL